MKRWILMFDGSSSHYHAQAYDGTEHQAHDMARMISQLYNVPVYVYQANDYPRIIRDIHDERSVKVDLGDIKKQPDAA